MAFFGMRPLPNKRGHGVTLNFNRNGTIEACDTLVIGGGEITDAIPSAAMENGLLSGLARYLKVQQMLGVEPPIALMVTVEGVRGVPLAVTNSPFGRMKDHAVDRDRLLIPDVLIENYQQSAGRILRSVFDAIYNAAGFQNCPRYTPEGEYDPKLAP